jgi:hypothetical protein
MDGGGLVTPQANKTKLHHDKGLLHEIVASVAEENRFQTSSSLYSRPPNDYRNWHLYLQWRTIWDKTLN